MEHGVREGFFLKEENLFSSRSTRPNSEKKKVIQRMKKMFKLTTPESFEFTNLGNWEKWLQRFQRFGEASKLWEKDNKTQVNTLIHCMGSVAENIFRTFSFS